MELPRYGAFTPKIIIRKLNLLANLPTGVAKGTTAPKFLAYLVILSMSFVAKWFQTYKTTSEEDQFSRVAESEIKYPIATPTFPNFPTPNPDSNLTKFQTPIFPNFRLPTP